MQFIRQSY